MTARFLVGDARELIAEVPDRSVDMFLSSPPYLALRSYLPADHPDKAREIGSEATQAAFIDTLLELTAEWRRVLAPHGTLAIELGDTYSGSGGAGGDYGTDGLREGQPRFKQRNDGGQYGYHGVRGGTKHNHDERPVTGGLGWPLAKSRTLIPELYRVALAYGINPLTGAESPAGRWRVRQVHYHCRPNPPVGALGDKFRPSVSEWVIACTSAKRWFDLDAVRTEPTSRPQRFLTPNPHYKGGVRTNQEFTGTEIEREPGNRCDPAGAPPLDHSWLDWDDWYPAAQRTPTTPYPGAHYATFGPPVIRPFIEAMCPRHVCTVCGEPRRRIVETVNAVGRRPDVSPRSGRFGMDTDATGVRFDLNGAPDRADVRTLGWTDCGHGDQWRPGLVLDPFAGTGTTGEVATGCGRDALLFDIDSRNLDLARQRLGMFLEEST